MYLFVPKDFSNKHIILQTIINHEIEHTKSNVINDCKDTSIHINRIAEMLKIPIQEAKVLTGSLIVSEEIQRCQTTDDKFLFSIANKGIVAYSDKTYLRQGRAYFITSFKDCLYIIVSGIAIISALSSLTLYITSTRNIQKEVTQLQHEVRDLKELVYPKAQKTK
jgi:hypothetical protein